MITFDEVVTHMRDRGYMSGIDRDRNRVKATSEVFTPYDLVQECLNALDQIIFDDKESSIIDRSCGDGQFLSEVLIRKMEHGATFEQALTTTYGVDLMEDNVALCRDRLLCGQEQYRHIVNQNIVCAHALRYHYRFDGSDPYKTEHDIHLESFFSFD